jgi:hypothetical protein
VSTPVTALPSSQHNLCFSEFLFELPLFRNTAIVRYRRHGMRSDRQHAVFRRHDRLRPPRSRGLVDPEIAKREVIARIASAEYQLHEIADCSVEEITAEVLSEAALPDIGATGADLQASHFDHVRDLRKHERA